MERLLATIGFALVTVGGLIGLYNYAWDMDDMRSDQFPFAAMYLVGSLVAVCVGTGGLAWLLLGFEVP